MEERGLQIREFLTGAAVDAGATSAGVARVGDLRASPSHRGLSILEGIDDEASVLVVGLHHPPDHPEMDWFTGSGGTDGNRLLMGINRVLASKLLDEYGVEAHDLPYYVERGGVFLKDAAVLAGLGVIGPGNLLVSPGIGPCIRLRGLLVRAHLPPSRPLDYHICQGCPAPCAGACPEEALDGKGFSRELCMKRMRSDGAGGLLMDPAPAGGDRVVKFCRLCELACPLAHGARPCLT